MNFKLRKAIRRIKKLRLMKITDIGDDLRKVGLGGVGIGLTGIVLVQDKISHTDGVLLLSIGLGIWLIGLLFAARSR